MPQPNLYSDEDLLDYLRRADDAVDGYLGGKTYRQIKEENWPCGRTFWSRFGSWKEAKQAAGLPARDQTYSEEGLNGEDYYDYVKDQLSCSVCDESFNGALAFHHPPGVKGDRNSDIRYHAPDRIKEEVSKCIAVCFNCHQKHHSKHHDINVNHHETVDPPEVEDVRTELV